MAPRDATEDRPDAGPRGLAAAILQRAVRDIREGKSPHAEAARAFLEGDWFEALAHECNIEPAAIRERLRSR
jgi:hypothetical protein